MPKKSARLDELSTEIRARFAATAWMLLEFERLGAQASEATADKEAKEVLKRAAQQTLRMLSLVLVWTAIDASLSALCQLIREDMHLPIKVTDLRADDDVKRAIKYLEVAGIKVASHPFDQTIHFLRRVRNRVVHHAGRIGSDKRDLNAVERLAGFHAQPNGQLWIEKEAVWSATTDAEGWLVALVTAVMT